MPRTKMILCLLLALTVPSAWATKRPLDEQEFDRPVVSDRWGLSLGGYLVDFKTDAQVGFGSLLGTLVRLESDLGLDKREKTLRVEGFYRFGQKHSVDFGLFQVTRGGEEFLDEPLDFLGLRFVGESKSEFDMDLFRVVWRYSFTNNGKTNAGFCAGLSTFDFLLELSGSAQALDETTGDPVGNVEYKEARSSFLAPVPVVGMFVEHALSRTLLVRARAEFFDLSVGDFEGRLIDTRMTLDWYFTRHVGLGFGGNTADLTYRSGDNKEPVRVDYNYGGLLAYLSVTFGGARH